MTTVCFIGSFLVYTTRFPSWDQHCGSKNAVVSPIDCELPLRASTFSSPLAGPPDNAKRAASGDQQMPNGEEISGNVRRLEPSRLAVARPDLPTQLPSESVNSCARVLSPQLSNAA